MHRLLTLAFTLLLLAGCEQSPSLPGDFRVMYADRGKAWLQNPDGSLTHGGLIKELYHDNRRILLLAQAVSYGGETVPPRPRDHSCYVALLVDGDTGDLRQIDMAEFEALSARMTPVESYERPCPTQ
jgi:hypothetical protein